MFLILPTLWGLIVLTWVLILWIKFKARCFYNIDLIKSCNVVKILSWKTAVCNSLGFIWNHESHNIRFVRKVLEINKIWKSGFPKFFQWRENRKSHVANFLFPIIGLSPALTMRLKYYFTFYHYCSICNILFYFLREEVL